MCRRSIAIVVCGLSAALALATIEAQAPVRELSPVEVSLETTGFGAVVLVYDVSEDSYAAVNADRVDRRLMPASTFKILNSLVALETGVIADPQTVIEWDGVVRERTELNRDLDLQTAYRLSALPHYQELARRIGAERMQQFIDAVGYGNRDISGGIDRFWLSGGLRISPREQVEFLTRLYRGELPFSEKTMAMVREMMVSERTADHTIHSKTGWAVLPGSDNVGWWVGWVDREAAVHVFATALEATAPDETFGAAREAVTRSVLEQLGVLE